MGIIDRTIWVGPEEGIPQGNVLSPLLSNVYLHRFDSEITRKGYPYIRYADDFVVLCKSKTEAEDAGRFSRIFLKNELSLKLNLESSPIKSIWEGFVFSDFFLKQKKGQ